MVKVLTDTSATGAVTRSWLRKGLAFTHVDFEPLEVKDFADASHWFHFTVYLLGDRVALNAYELVNGEPEGYQFQVIGDAEVDLFEWISKMVSRIRRALAVQHLQFEGPAGLQIATVHHAKRGQIWRVDLELARRLQPSHNPLVFMRFPTLRRKRIKKR